MSQKIVLITGANQGLGYEVVKKLAAEHENYLIILCARDIKKGQDAASKVPKLAHNTKVDVVQLDVTNDDSIAAAVKTVESTYGHLDVLFNNAGISHSSGTERQQMLAVYEVNVVGVALVTKAFLPLLMKSQTKRLVIMSSDVGSIGWAIDPNYKNKFFQDTIYKPSKAGTNMVGAVMSVLHGKDGLRVNLVNPGFRSTAFNGYNERAGDAAGGAVEPVAVITQEGGDVLSYTEYEDGKRTTIPW